MLGLYIHIPFCKQKCTYCDFCSFPSGSELIERYVKALTNEIALASTTVEGSVVDTVFFGGGTPTLLSAEQLRRIFNAVEQHFTYADSVEISVESNPATLTEDHLKLFREKKVTRISIGLQTTQPRLLKRLGRVHTLDQFVDTFKQARNAGPWDINVDLIYHLPGQTKEDWLETLNRVILLNPEHISCYSLQLEEGTPLDSAVKAGRYTVSGDKTNRWMHHAAIDLLAQKGYRQYEISNFAKPGHSCRHNIRYWKREPYLGLGLGAHGFDGTRRRANPQSMDAYLEALESGKLASEIVETLTLQEALFETVMLGLRMNAGIHWEDVMRGCQPEKREAWEAVLKTLESQELLVFEGGILRLTRLGMDLSNRVFAAFMDIKEA